MPQSRISCQSDEGLRRAFFLENLGEAVRDLYLTSQPRRILDACLLSAMGPLAAESGFMLVLDDRADMRRDARADPQAEGGGFEETSGRSSEPEPPILTARGETPPGLLETAPVFLSPIKALAAAPGSGASPGDPWASLVDEAFLSRFGLKSASMRLAAVFRCDFRRHGLLVVSGRYSGAPFGRIEAEYLENLTRMGATALRQAYALSEAKQMAAEVARKNAALADALRTTRQRGARLDREAFRLRNLLEASQDMSLAAQPDTIPEAVLEASLLNCMGGFGARGGFAFLLDRAQGRCFSTVRGSVPAGLESIEPEVCDRELFSAFSSLPEKALKPMSVGFPKQAASAISATSAQNEPARGDLQVSKDRELRALFVLSEERIGLIALFGLPETIRPKAASARQSTPERGETNHTIDPSHGSAPENTAPREAGSFGNVAALNDDGFLEAHVLALLPRLDACLAMRTIRELNADLSRRNADLEESLRALSEARTTISGLESAIGQVRDSLRQAGEQTIRARGWDFCLLFGVSLLLAFLYNFASPHGLRLIPEHALASREARMPDMAVTELARRLASKSVIVVDARPAEMFDATRVRGAVSLPAPLFDFTYMLRSAELTMDADIVVYGATISRLYDSTVAEKLRTRGHERVFLLAGGRSGWQSGALPLEGTEVTGPPSAPGGGETPKRGKP